MIHTTPSPLAGKTVRVCLVGPDDVVDVDVEDWWDRVAGISWSRADGNLAAMTYGMRIGLAGLGAVPLDDEVLYGFAQGMGKILFHVSEVVDPERARTDGAT